MSEVATAPRAIDYGFIPHPMRIELLAAIQRQRAQLDAQEQQLLHAMNTDPLPNGDGSPALDKQWVREDVACALRVPPALAQARLSTASELVTRLPATLALLERGEISLRHATRLVEAVRPLPEATTAEVENRVLARAVHQTVAEFAISVRRAVLAADPRPGDERHRDAVAERRVVFTAQDDGTCQLWALLAADAAAALKTVLDRAADCTKGLDDRTADQRRADALTDLALGTGTGGGVKPAVNVTVALSTLLDLDDQPGELDGHGPIPAALARALAFDATGTWRRLLTDARGQLVEVSSDSYRPPVRMARHVRAAQQTCCFPGCRRPARRCELDHIDPWHDGGPTCPANLQPLCSRHHHLKHDAGWQVRRDPEGTTRWQSPSGHTYARPPDELPRDSTSMHPPPGQADDLPPF
jgi:hypothetical protein